ncbi:SpvB/TcaC N-terminal domain-containing protein [uncultured Nostoc sp.]|uniref:SpvB/TcaC N-terminal domain-containing protein n=1 Tax=uncultured Nostoc sp. TaxID=340711 RepID=UPI0035CB19FA
MLDSSSQYGQRESASSAQGDNGSDQNYFSPPPAVSLPKGGGAIQGIGEKFSANPVTGTASLNVPIFTTPSRSDFYPKLSLAYDSGAGNGAFGFGWMLSVPSVTRKTEKEGLPRYWDAEESDIFILSEAEDLVPVLGEDIPPSQLGNQTYTIKRYRPRIEGLFARIEKWQNQADQTDVFWKSVSKDNVTSLYGKSNNSQIADPQNSFRIFKWLLCESYDDRGNQIIYEYKVENTDNVDRSQPQEKYRLVNQEVAANRYLKSIKYGNRTPQGNDWLFQVVFDYGEHSVDNPQLTEVQPWSCRPDAFSTFRSCFEIRTYRLCQRVLMFHYLSASGELTDTPLLVHSTDFTYEPTPIVTYLASVTQSGYVQDTATSQYLQKSLPKLEFTYSQPEVEAKIQIVDSLSIENLPIGLDGTRYQWVDLDSEGLSGILTEQGNAWFYKRNLGSSKLTIPVDQTTPPLTPAPTTVEFAPMELVATQPSIANLQGGQQQLMELTGDGQKYLVQFSRPLSGYYRRNEDKQWGDFKPFPLCLNVNWNDPHLKFIDLNGDGFADVLIEEDTVFTWYRSLTRDGFGNPQQVRKGWDEEQGPTTLVFTDPTQSIYLADMDGDGLTDIVRIRNGEVCYWSNLGYGQFGQKVTMANAPWFDYIDQFDQKRIRLGDIDGSGTTDIIYLGSNRISLFFNQSGNSWSAPQYLSSFPRVDNLSSVQVVDLLGNGTACLVWSSPLPGNARQPMRYIDLMGGQKPHLMVSVKNNMGMERSLTYTASTRFYLEARLAGTPWVTKLPFPVQVLTRVETTDTVTQTQLVTLYRYHHGYFDGFEREFRGFGLVETWDTESFPDTGDTFQVPPIYTKTWYHTGAYIDQNKISTYFAHEYYREPGETDPTFAASLLPDTILPSGLTFQEEREAARSLKGRILRQEIYALDGTDKQPNPYSVSERNYEIRVEQRLLTNRHAVFFTHDRETIDYHYERNPADPRVTHAMTLEVDEFGNGLKSVAIAYPRRIPAYPEQDKTFITYTENQVTNKPNEQAGDPEWYRLGVPIETRTYELTGYTVTGSRFQSTDFVQPEPSNPGAFILIYDSEINYEDTPTSGKQRRLIEQVRTLYRHDSDANTTDPTPLSLGQIDSLALPCESFKLAFTPGLLTQVYSSKIAAADLNTLLNGEGKYIQQDGDWWIPSGRQAFDPAQFYLVIATKDPFGQIFTTTYDPYKLLPIQSQDPVGNVVQISNDYRVMHPQTITDPNGNRTQAMFDALGMVVGTAVMGKVTETLGDSFASFNADLTQGEITAFFDATANSNDPRSLAIQYLGTATTCFIYDLEQIPVCAAAIARKQHVSDLAGQPLTPNDVQVSFVYSDGFGREAQSKVQAEPGPTDPNVPNSPVLNPRWVGTGAKVYNNKGKPVRQYEPFFTATYQFGIEQWGISSTLFYDPVERVVATLHPNQTWEKVVFDPWQQQTFDVNDTVTFDPKTDADVSGFLTRLPDADYLPTWYQQRSSGALGVDEQDAATKKAAVHANTPTIAHFDTLGRTFLTIADNGAGGKYETRVELDIEGNQRSVTDALGRIVMRYDYDLLGHRLHQSSMEAGQRWMLNNVAGKPIRMWDSRDHVFSTTYDALQCPIQLFVKTGSASAMLVEETIYGEGQGDANNLRGRIYKHFDNAGVATNVAFDFKGNLVSSTRQLVQDYKTIPDWSLNPVLETEVFSSSTRYDALNRPIQLVAPHSNLPNRPINVIQPGYNEANLLEQMNVWLGQTTAPTTLLASSSANLPAVTNIEYDAKGQRTLIAYGNGVITQYVYDPKTFRLINLITKRGSAVFPNDCPSPTQIPCGIQNLNYTFDPVGNITRIRDNAQQTIFFNNQKVQPLWDYTYDPIYRLITALGRENIGQVTKPQTTWDDQYRVNLAHPNDAQAMQNYSEQYLYDAVGNFEKLIHQVFNPKYPTSIWTRTYNYNEPSLIEPAKQSNRLSNTTVGATTEPYTYDAHGNMTSMPQLTQMEWNYKDELSVTVQQAANDTTVPETTYYVYDASGQRVRKITEGQNGTRINERIYLGGFELYREFNGSGNTITLERETLHVMDDKQRIALVETKTITNPDDESSTQLIRYQFSNHLGSACLELDDKANVISYEEYYPYGSTSYQAVDKSVKAAAKRYRYTGKERDEETGLYYHSARYFIEWLGRWVNCDPLGIEADGPNLYCYTRNNPLRYSDKTGTDPDPLENAGRSTVPGPSSNDSLGSSQPTQIGSDVQMQNLGPTQNAFVLRAIRPYATLEATGSGLLQSTTDPRQGWTGQVGGGLQARFTLNPNTEVGVGGTYGRVFTLGGVPLLGPANMGSVYGSVHFSEAQPTNTDSDNFSGGGFFGQAGANFGAGPNGETSWFASGAGAYSWGWPNNTVFRGLDVNAGLAAFDYNQINGVSVRNLLVSFASVNISLPKNFNFEVYGSVPIGTGGNLSDPAATGTPASLRLGVGLGAQVPLGNYAIGAEVGVVGEFANVRVPDQPNAPFNNVSPWINIGFGAVNRRADSFGNTSAFPARY